MVAWEIDKELQACMLGLSKIDKELQEFTIGQTEYIYSFDTCFFFT